MEYLRPTFAEINLTHIVHNLNIIKKTLNNTRILAVVKANAYGHGSIAVSKKLEQEGVNYFGVSSIEEGIILRDAGIQSAILIMGSQYPLENFREVIHRSLIPTIASYEAACELSKYAQGLNKQVEYHYKVDTGMGRIGVNKENAFETLKKINMLPNISIQGLYTHLAKAENDPRFTNGQLASFASLIKNVRKLINRPVIMHAANSAAVLGISKSHLDMVRVGLALYGLKPYSGAKTFLELKPVLSLKSKIVFLKKVPKNTPISYGATYRTKRPSLIATIPIGYADGYNRLLSNKGSVIIRDKRLPVVGRVTMDMIMVDVTTLDNAHVGDDVILIGSQGGASISAESIASLTKTISYEVACQISSRVPRKYTETAL